VGRILREAERLNALVTDLLEYGRPRPLALAAADPDETWDEVLEGNRALLEMRSLALSRTRARPPGGRGHAHWLVDREQLAQAFRNVLTNAVDAAPADSDLTLASTVLPDGAWRCTLRNAGPAVPPDALPRVFDLFFSTKQGGTGVGLTISRRIVEDHGGTLALDSGPGGTTVTITLPPSRGRAPE
jgi:signal transduction histidine kinase